MKMTRLLLLGLTVLVGLWMSTIASAVIVLGNTNGSVTLVEFYDYQCPSCKAMVTVMDMLTKNDPYLRVVYNNYPILGETSVYAAKAAIASVAQNKFPQFHNALMVQKNKLTPQVVLDIAKQVGLNMQQLTQDMNSAQVTDELAKQIQLGSALGVRVTPTFILGATRADVQPRQFQGAVDYLTLQNAIILLNNQSNIAHPTVKN